MLIKANSTWETHSHHARRPCQCGGEFRFQRAQILQWTEDEKVERILSQCDACSADIATDFDITELIQTEADFGWIEKKWRPSSGRAYPMAENKFPRASTTSELETFSIMGEWLLLGSAQGSMGTAFLCLRRTDPLQMAVAKLPTNPTDPDDVEAHLRECELLLMLNLGRRSPHVVALLGIDARPAGIPVWMLETVLPGPRGCVTLADWISAFSEDIADLPARPWLGQIVTGLIHCGELVEGFVHGDLKPDNVLVAPGWICKIADFGLSGWRTRPARPGAALYRAPELWDGGEPSPKSDVFSVGVIAYELLTGLPPWRWSRDPFEGMDKLKAIQRRRLMRPDTRVPAIILRCLEVDPADRPTLADLQDAFDCPEVRRELLPPIDQDFGAVSKALIGIGRPQLVINAIANSKLSIGTAARVNLAIALSQCGEHATAETHYAKLAEEGVDVSEKRAVNSHRRGLHREALDVLLPLIDKNPNSVGLRINASAAANDVGEHSLALELLQPAKELDPGNATVVYQLTATLIFLKKCSKAKKMLERFVAIGGAADAATALQDALRQSCPRLFS